MEQSIETAALFEALAKAQGRIKNAPFDRENPHFKSRYATQASLRDVSQEALAENGLSVIQSTVNGEPGWAGVETMLCHASGQWVKSCLLIPTTKADAQGYGSAITYARRYSFSAILGLASEEDDDGTAASQPQQQRRQPESRGDDRAATRAPSNPSGSFACTGAGCGTALTKGQHDISVRSYGKALCPACQKISREETPADAEPTASQQCLEFVPEDKRRDKAEVRRILEGAYGGALPPWKEMTEELWAETLRCLQTGIAGGGGHPQAEIDPFEDPAEGLQ